MRSMTGIVLAFALALICTSIGLYGAMMGLFWRAMVRRGKLRSPAVRVGPFISILKPLAGCDDDLEENLESFAKLEYQDFEILLGIADVSDGARAIAQRFLARHPGLRGRLVVTNPKAAINPKVAQLIGLEGAALGEVYVISDSNIRVGPAYLASMVAELENPRVGLVTSLFSGTGERNLGAAIENLQICAWTAPGIASTQEATGRPLSVGKSMAVRRRDLAALGGFRALGHVLAEDHLLGQMYKEAGFEARLALDVVENRNTHCTIARTLERHTRWAKMRRFLIPSGFGLEPLLSPIAVASAALVLVPCKLTGAMLGLAWLFQMVGALVCAKLLRGGALDWRMAPLEIARAYASVLCWLLAYAGRRIGWRGHTFTLHRGSVIVPVAVESERPARARARRTEMAA